MVSRRLFVGTAVGVGALSIARLACAQSPSATGNDVVTPEMFGARGDGVTNDSAAFAALSDHVNRQGGGVVVFRPVTYLVGAQTRGSGGTDYAFEPARLLEFVGCSRPLILRGNGARIRSAGRLRFGTFNARSGAATRHPLPYFGRGEMATPYRWMIKVERCSSLVEISDFELDGNVQQAFVGGGWGDTGHQIPAYGLGLYNNGGPEVVSNIHTHHHALDGLVIDGLDRSRGVRSRLENIRSEYNGRQGCSIVGGRSYDFAKSRFNHTGKAGVTTAPGAGVDIEAEEKKIRDLTFTDCTFSDNTGAGLLAESGDSEGAVFTRCSFIGSSSWSAWPNKPSFRFHDCIFVGPITNAYGDSRQRERATQFLECKFTDDPALSPTRAIYRGTHPHSPICELSANPNVLFNRCSFQLDHIGTLPWSVDVTYADCTMVQKSPKESYPRGFYVGRNIISGRADINGSTISGELILNGVRVPPGRIG